MSTEYKIQVDKTGADLSVTEHSCKFDIEIDDNSPISTGALGLYDLTEKDLAVIIVKLAQVLGYFNTDILKHVAQVIKDQPSDPEKELDRWINNGTVTPDVKYAIGTIDNVKNFGSFSQGPFESIQQAVDMSGSSIYLQEPSPSWKKDVICKLEMDKDPVIIGYVI